jgi:pimeloyl-ACP methyl ester carboxylesterase
LVWESGQAATEVGLSMFYRNPPTKVDESKVTCPVLVIGAKHDTVMPPVIVKKIAKKYHAVSTYKEFSNHGHTILAEDGCLEVTKYISDWLVNPETLVKKYNASEPIVYPILPQFLFNNVCRGEVNK